jgi:charged multivesicular body protein 4
MSFLKKIFGGKKEDKPQTIDQATQNVRDTEAMLLKKQDFLGKKIEATITIARKNGTRNKTGI